MYIIADTRLSTIVLGLEDKMIDNIKIYPNPNNGIINIYSPSKKHLFTDIEILDLSGKVLKRMKADKEQYELKLSNGIYIIKLINGNETIRIEKIILDN